MPDGGRKEIQEAPLATLLAWSDQSAQWHRELLQLHRADMRHRTTEWRPPRRSAQWQRGRMRRRRCLLHSVEGAEPPLITEMLEYADQGPGGGAGTSAA